MSYLEGLVADIKRDDPDAKLAALRQLKDLLSGDLFHSLRESLKDKNPEVRLHAAQVLLRAHDELAIELILNEVSREGSEYIHILYYKLMDEARRTGGVHDDRILTALKDRIRNVSGENRMYVMCCLVFCGAPEGQRLLSEFCDHISRATKAELEQFLSEAIYFPAETIYSQASLVKDFELLADSVSFEALSNLPILSEQMPPNDKIDALLSQWAQSEDRYLRQNAITALKVRSANK